MLIKKHLDLLGHKVKDKVSDFQGVVISMSFDLYGCIQADVRSMELDEKGMVRGGIWMDVSMVVKLVMIPSHIFWSGYEEGGRS